MYKKGFHLRILTHYLSKVYLMKAALFIILSILVVYLQLLPIFSKRS